MDSKIIIAIAIAAAVVIGGSVAFAVFDDDDDDQTLYPYTTTYVGNGGKTANGETTFTSHEAKILDNMFVNEGKTFLGWNLEKDGSSFYLPVGNAALGGGNIYAIWGIKVTVDDVELNDTTFDFMFLDTSMSFEKGKVNSCKELSNVLLATTDHLDGAKITNLSVTGNTFTFDLINSKSSDGSYSATVTSTGATIGEIVVSTDELTPGMSGAVGVLIYLDATSSDVHLSGTVVKTA